MKIHTEENTKLQEKEFKLGLIEWFGTDAGKD